MGKGILKGGGKAANPATMMLVASNGGATLVRCTRHGETVHADVLATQHDGHLAGALKALAARPELIGAPVSVLLGGVITKTEIMALPRASRDVRAKLIAAQLGPSERFVSQPSGTPREGGDTMDAWMVSSVTAATMDDLVRPLTAAGTPTSEVMAADAMLMAFGRSHATTGRDGLEIAVLVEPSRLNLVCVTQGRAIFVRHVETAPEIDAETRARTLLTEIQRTTLAVRGRLKVPPPSGATVIDPLHLLAAETLTALATEAALVVDLRPVPWEIRGETNAAALGDALRAAATVALSPLAHARKDWCFPGTHRASRQTTQLRVAAIAAMVGLSWVATYAGHRRMQSEITMGQQASLTLPPAPLEDPAIRTLNQRDRIAAFTTQFGGVVADLSPATQVAPLLEAVAAATPAGVALDHVDIAWAPTGQNRTTKVAGFVRGTLFNARPLVRDLGANLQMVDHLVAFEEAPIDADPFASAALNRERATTPFQFVLQTGATR